MQFLDKTIIVYYYALRNEIYLEMTATVAKVGMYFYFGQVDTFYKDGCTDFNLLSKSKTNSEHVTVIR